MPKNQKNEYDDIPVEAADREWPDAPEMLKAASAYVSFDLEDDRDRRSTTD